MTKTSGNHAEPLSMPMARHPEKTDHEADNMRKPTINCHRRTVLRAWASLRDSHFPTAATKTNFSVTLQFQCLDNTL